MYSNNIELYNSVWNNIFLKKNILDYSSLFNLFSTNIYFKTIEEWEQFKFKEYLVCVTFGFNFEFNKHQLPENIKEVHLATLPEDKTHENFVPVHVESIHINSKIDREITINQSTLNSPYLNSISKASKLKSLSVFVTPDQESELLVHKIPESVENLKIFISKLEKNVLPANLKRLTIQSLKSFEDGSFPASLTHLNSYGNPLLINQLSSFSGLVKLEFSSSVFPIESNIQFPTSLQDLKISCCTFNTQLPSGLRILKLFMERFEHEIQFPSTLEDLTVIYDNNESSKQIFQDYQVVPPNLKSLLLTCSTILDSNGHTILPDGLEKFTISGESFYDNLQADQLPSSLTYLNLGSSFFHEIDINVLPSNLKTLILGGGYNQVINPLALPKQLELLDIKSENYNHNLSNLSTTHPNTVVLLPNLQHYYEPSNTQIRVLRLPSSFDEPLSKLKLQDKSNLEYLHLGYSFNYEIQLSDLPSQNNIRILELSNEFSQTINLEHFQNLETIVVNFPFTLFGATSKNLPKFKTISSLDQLNNISQNFYKLKEIIISPQIKTSKYIKQIDSNFYKFLKINKSN